MDFINDFINIVFVPLSIISLFFFQPPFLFFKYLFSALRAFFFTEDVAGKVVLITGASSGIGEHLAYEYAKRRACLALVARREHRLQQVAATAEKIGSPNAIFIPGDVSKLEDCQRFVDATVNHFGRLDHLVVGAGVCPVSMLEDIPDITKMASAMDINFWGSVYSSYFAIPYLKTTKGKMIVIASFASCLPLPRMSLYSASKAAVVSMYETLRVELGHEIGITIVSPGLINTEMTQGKFLNQQGRLEVDKEMKDVQVSVMPMESVSKCAKSIVNAACRGEKNLIEPAWYRAVFFCKVFLPETIEWSNRFFLVPRHGHSQRDTISKKTVDLAL
ncbi:11-beta-hydroxysteroid dehydrogenase A-like isoform X2 [Euphorbia lathyris]|uniref:11-beta-hydroxysteroid dehydrogenase A-like isoform X2 n=1 Tax=Euphorbia lathyris TaxID=212925 RepID=UPI0033139F7A